MRAPEGYEGVVGITYVEQPTRVAWAMDSFAPSVPDSWVRDMVVGRLRVAVERGGTTADWRTLDVVISRTPTVTYAYATVEEAP